MDIVGDSPEILSTSGLSIFPRNCLAYEDNDSTYLLCPSAYIVSKAKELLPDPDTPVITTSLFLGIEMSISFKLCSLAPRMFIFLSSILVLNV